jgi:hypothetical protein
MDRINDWNPKDSYVYRINLGICHATPSGSNIFGKYNFYKHSIPTELTNKIMQQE